jgi:hypothetical protein
MLKQFSLVCAAAALSTVAFGQIPGAAIGYADGYYQLGYAANLNIGDAVVNFSNDGYSGGVVGATPATAGNLCANVYVFDPNEEEVSCCSCLVTPNALDSISAKNDLINNVLTPAIPTSIVIKIIASQPSTSTSGAYTICNPATAGTNILNPLEYGLMVWGTTLEPSSPAGTYNSVAVAYKNGLLSPTGGGWLKIDTLGVTTPFGGGTPPLFAPVVGRELSGLTTLCNFVQQEGSGFGTCSSCALGALSGNKQ